LRISSNCLTNSVSRGNVQLLALGEPELLIDEIAQKIFVSVGDLLHAGAALARLIVHLLHGAVVVGSGDDLVVHPGHDVFDRDASVGALRNGTGWVVLRLHTRNEKSRSQDQRCRSQHDRRSESNTPSGPGSIDGSCSAA
jgi:hypothetical protein